LTNFGAGRQSKLRAALALEELDQQSRAEPVRHIQTGGIVIMLGSPTQRALPPGPAMPVLEMEPADGAPGVSGTPNPAAPYTTGAPY
jgi:hypothetical protein